MIKRVIRWLFIGVGAVIAALFLAVAASLVHTKSKGESFKNEKLVFVNQLRVPPLLEPRVVSDEKNFTINIEDAATEILPGARTRTRGYNGAILGPTIRVRKGDKVRMHVTNMLSEPTTLHWHGMHLPAVMDGGPHQLIVPGASWEPYWTITNEAGTLWYHPHMLGKTAIQVYAGLAGLLIIDDENSDSLDLPRTYGVDDIPLIVQDRSFDANNQFVYKHKRRSRLSAGETGDTILVNGTYAPYVDVPTSLIRLRILNGSNARRYNFGFSDGRAFHQIASDGGLLASPEARTRMILSPGERAEIAVDTSDGAKTTLMSYEVTDGLSALRHSAFRLVLGSDDRFQRFKLLELRPNGKGGATPRLPEKLNTIERLPPARATRTRTFLLDEASINGKLMDHARVDEIVKNGDVEIWSITPVLPMLYHNFHIHGVQFQVLDRARNGKRSEPPSAESGWKDTVIVGPHETVRVIARFGGFADPSRPYMFHCHILEHEDMGMMGQYVVVDDLKQPVRIDTGLEPALMQSMAHPVSGHIRAKSQ